MGRMIVIRNLAVTGLLVIGGAAMAQEKTEDIRIVVPAVDKAAKTVTLPGAFWNEQLADWLDVAFCGRPSDFLHETVVSVTTTRTLLEQALRDIGCHDGDAWVDSVQNFPRVRGDRFMVVLEVEREGGGGKKEKYSLDELMTFIRWGVSMGPYGFMFKGDPDHKAAGPAGTLPGAGGGAGDSAKILRDDPQIALVFRGIQSLSQSFADHPLAYVESRWEWEEIHRGRNHGVLPAAVFDSNGKAPVTVTLKKVSEEQLISESATLWHEQGFKAYMLKQVEVARQLDREKAEYWTLRPEAARQRAVTRELRDPAEEARIQGRTAVLMAEIERDYAALDAAWSAWAGDHVKLATEDAAEAAFVREQARLWGEYMALNKERLEQLAIAAELTAQTAGKPALAGRALEARSRALIAENKQSRDYWQQQWDKIQEPQAEDVWAQMARLRLALVEARLKVGAAGVAYGQAQQANPLDEAKAADLKKALEAAVTKMTLAEARMSLANVEFEISKREGLTGAETELAALKRQRDELAAKIKELEAAKP
jgi:hypothetical protein